jgi:hypothetical protein
MQSTLHKALPRKEKEPLLIRQSKGLAILAVLSAIIGGFVARRRKNKQIAWQRDHAAQGYPDLRKDKSTFNRDELH